MLHKFHYRLSEFIEVIGDLISGVLECAPDSDQLYLSHIAGVMHCSLFTYPEHNKMVAWLLP